MKKYYYNFNSFLAKDLETYVNGKQAIGYKYKTEKLALHLLDKYIVESNIIQITSITIKKLEEFLMSRNRSRPRSYNHLLSVIRNFFKWLMMDQNLQPIFQFPEPRRAVSQRLPFIFKDEQAISLLKLTAKLPDNNKAKHRSEIYSVIFSLLYNLGLRVREVSRLRIKDVELNQQFLTICQTKFNKTRYVPFGPKLKERLTKYFELCKLDFDKKENFLFTFDGYRSINPCTISMVFHHLTSHMGLIIPPGTSPPRLHHLRHSFAVNTLLKWYQSGIDAGQKLIHLSTFLGHVDPTSTAVYLQITQELLRAANDRFEQYAIKLLQGERQ